MRTLEIAGRRAPLVFTVLITSCLIAACGSSASSSSSTTSTSATTQVAAAGNGQSSARRTALRNCLKAHGVTLPARRGGSAGGPPPGGGPGFFGGGGGGGAGGFSSNPKVRAAIQACGGGNFRGGRRAQFSHQAINSYVACVRRHGYNMPSPNFSGKGAVFPASIRSDAKFQAASRACQNLLFPNRSTTTNPTS